MTVWLYAPYVKFVEIKELSTFYIHIFPRDSNFPESQTSYTVKIPPLKKSPLIHSMTV